MLTTCTLLALVLAGLGLVPADLTFCDRGGTASSTDLTFTNVRVFRLRSVKVTVLVVECTLALLLFTLLPVLLDILPPPPPLLLVPCDTDAG